MSVRTLADYVPAIAARDPDRIAVAAGDRELTYAELDERSAGFAGALGDAGVGRGDRVALVLANGIDATVAIHGTLRAGAALAPLSAGIKRDRLAYVLSDTEPAVVVCDSEHMEVSREAAALSGSMPVLDDVAALVESGGTPAASPFETDLACLMSTSGSTGHPKGVMLTHHNVCFATDSIVEYLKITPEDRILCLLQLSFGYGLSQLLCCARVGATLVLETGFAMPGKVVQALERHRVTGLPGVPTVFQVLVSLSGLAERELPDLRFLTNAGAALPAATVEALRRTFPRAEIYSMYGLTECIRVSYLPPDQISERPTSSGIPMPGTEAWVEDEDGNVLGPGEVGELKVRGGHVMEGYWRDPEATAEKVRGTLPWERVLSTGDLFRRDEEGFLFWVGRTDDLIKSRGEKVYPREVEEVLHDAEGVKEAIVVGDSDRLLGQAVHAHVAPNEGHSLSDAELRRICAEKLEDHMVPKRITIHERLPRTARGKVDRQALIQGADPPEAPAG